MKTRTHTTNVYGMSRDTTSPPEALPARGTECSIFCGPGVRSCGDNYPGYGSACAAL
jgi:hypothetical protein